MEMDTNLTANVCIGVTSDEPANEASVQVIEVPMSAQKSKGENPSNCDFLVCIVLDVDYFYETATVVINTGTTKDQPPQCVQFTIVGDDIFENDEIIIFMLNSSDPSILDASALMTFVTIIDDDSKFLVVIHYIHLPKHFMAMFKA